MIITDGHENASTDFSGEQISKLLEAKQEEGWTILFLGANQDAFATGQGMNMRGGNVRNFRPDEPGIKSALLLMSDAVSSHRGRAREERAHYKDKLFDERDGR